MYTNDYILNLLNIKDKNISICSNNIKEIKIKGKNYKIKIPKIQINLIFV